MPKNDDAATKPEKERRYRLGDMIRADKMLSKPARTVGHYLAGLCDVNQPYAYCKQDHIAETFSMSERAVRAAIKNIVDRGYFTRKRNGSSRGEGWGSNQYHPVWSVLTDPTGLKQPVALSAAVSGNLPEGRQISAGRAGEFQPVEQAENGRYIIGEHQSVTSGKKPVGNCSASRTVPVADADLAGDDGWCQLLACHPWRQDHHKGMLDGFWWRTFDQARSKHGLENVIARVSRRADLFKRMGFGNLSSAGHFLDNEFGCTA